MPEYNLDDLIKKFEEFFDLKCRKDVEKLAANYPAQKSLEIDYAELEKFDVELADELIEKPDAVIEAAENALAQMPLPRMPGAEFEPHARFFNLPDRGLLIERMGAQHINKMLCFDGLITKRAEVRPRVRIALFVCKYCDAEYKVPVGKNSKEPSVCESCKRRGLAVDEDRSYFVNLQRADAQEPLEKLRGGEPASHMDVRLEDDLVNQVVPGDNVTLTGILRIIPPMKGKIGYSMYIDVVHVKKQKREFEEIELTKEEETEIKKLAKDPKLYDKLIGSIAPALYGYDEVKEGIALQLFGGTPDLVLSGGGKIRSDMHILLIGDPGVGKTRFLQYVQQIAPKSIYVGGKTLTGVGLTASAEKDMEFGEGGWVLKAGALVLASGGIVSIDEFDKVSDDDKAALHEVMESQRVSIAKAGIVAQMRAKTAILAAANPEFGRFDQSKSVADQFKIIPTLLSRFDLIFPIKDILDPSEDKKLAGFVLDSHRSAAMGTEPPKSSDVPIISTELLRKYIAYARKTIRPVLSAEAADKLKGYYEEMRSLGKRGGPVPITPRQLEGLIRMSQAVAKMRLSMEVTVADSERAIRLMEFVLRQTAFDVTTQTLDIDMITGQQKSKIDKFNAIMDIVADLQKNGEMVEVKAVVDAAKAQSIDERVVVQLIDDKVTKGDYYKPKHGYIKIVKRFE
ncbi:MAG: minichromosome maintenance protein MCM [Candidatus Burarchaeum sp.]|nr:minichromosome maintenance protein MCM [Candidatus Burarchaeum sp.]MDO8339810.1 minichromosome maintenance protein MCM [Candidatus Burarchaeum sp.]